MPKDGFDDAFNEEDSKLDHKPDDLVEDPHPDEDEKTAEKDGEKKEPAKAEAPDREETEDDPDEDAEASAKQESVPHARFNQVNEELKQLKQQLAALQQAPQQPQQPQPQTEPEKVPDPIEDPQGYVDYMSRQSQQMARKTTLMISERFARSQNEDFEEIKSWAHQRSATDAAFNAAMVQSEDPYGDAVRIYRQEQLSQELSPEDLEAFRKWKAGQVPADGQEVTTAEKPNLPPKVLGANGGDKAVKTPGEKEFFTEVFAR